MSFGDPALYGLATTESSRWNELAAGWLAGGYDSQLLRDFATLSPAECAVLADELMPEVLASIGLDVGRTDVDFRLQVFELSGFAARCRTAMAVVQRDLERTGRGEFRLHPVDTTPWDFAYETTLQACAALPDGTYSVEFDNPMTPDLDDAELLVHATASICDTLLLVSQVRWPRCVRHRTRYLVPYSPAEGWDPDEGDDRVWWWCNAADVHRVQPVGELAASA